MLDTKVSRKLCTCYMTGSVAWDGHMDAGSNQWLWAMHPAWRHLCWGPSATHHCCCSFGVAAHWLYQCWGSCWVGSAPRHGECFGLLQLLCETHHGICDPWSNCKNHCWVSVVGMYLDLWSTSQDPEWLGASFESNIIRELCDLMGIQKVWTSPYHAQANGQVEWVAKCWCAW